MEPSRRDELQKLMFFEQTREQAEKEHRANPNDAHALTRWGGSLLELAHFRQGTEAVDLIEQAVSKLEAAIKINPKRHDAQWCLGNALTSQGFLFPDAATANKYFERARACFEKALDEEPRNETYKKAVEMTAKAPYLHQQLQVQLQQEQQQQQQQQQIQAQQMGMAGGQKAEENEFGGYSDFFFDMVGWSVLAGLAVGWVMLARSQMK